MPRVKASQNESDFSESPSIDEEVIEDLDQGVIRPIPLQSEDTKSGLVKRLIDNMRQQLDYLERMLDREMEIEELESLVNRRQSWEGDYVPQGVQGRMIDGVFDGEGMIGEDGHKYQVPPNYASKSKLVEGDMLRLTITDAGRFIYKQKGPIERQRLMGTLSLDEQQNEWRVTANGSKYRVIPASVSYYKGQAGDDAVILVPKNSPSKWAAVENIIKRDLSTFSE